MEHVPYWLTFILVLFIWETRPTGTEYISKYVCSGDSTQLFENIKIDSYNIAVFLFVSGAKSHQIAMWTMQNVTIADGYSKKVFHDSHGDIWIRKVHLSDEAKYTLKYRKGINSSTSEVNLTVLVAPTRNCKPKLKRMGDILSASLDAHNCGKPAASVYWLDYPGIHYEGNDLVKLPPNYKAGTYYACIRSPATRCEKNSTLSDYCSKLTIDDITENSRSESSFAMLIVITVMIPLVTLVLVFIQCWGRKRNKAICKRGRDAVHTTEKEKLNVSEQSANIGNGV